MMVVFLFERCKDMDNRKGNGKFFAVSYSSIRTSEYCTTLFRLCMKTARVPNPVWQPIGWRLVGRVSELDEKTVETSNGNEKSHFS
jgi:hypothetical protein